MGKKRKKKEQTHEIENVVISADGKTMDFTHVDDNKRHKNVPICTICGGHHPRGRMTMRECDGHASVKEHLCPSFARGK